MVRESGGGTRPRKHCRVINIPKQNAAALTAARRVDVRDNASVGGDDTLCREFGAKIGLCFGPKAPGRKNEEVALIKAARELGGNSSAHRGTHGRLPQRIRALFFEELPIS